MNRLLDDDIVTALGAILDTAPSPIGRPSVPEAAEAGSDIVLLPGLQPRRVRRGGLVLVAAVSLVAVGGLAVLNRRSSTVVFSLSSTSVADSIEPSSVTTQATRTTTVASLSKYTGWYLPTFLPAGYEITSIDASFATDTNPIPQRWLRTDATGNVMATLTASTYPPVPPTPGKPETYNATVHGHQAFAGDTGEGIVVSWEEAGRVVAIRGVSLSSSETLSMAEATTIDSRTGAVALRDDANFVAVVSTPAAPDAIGLNIGLLRSDGGNGGFAAFTSSPANGETLQTLKQRVDLTGGRKVSIEKLGAFERLVDRHPADDLGPFTEVTWIQDGLMMDVVGRASADEVIRMAESVQVAEPQRLVAEGERITERLLALATLEQATLADGTVVSVKARDGNPVGLCVEAPVSVCRWHVSEGSLVGERQVGLFDTFDIAGRIVLVGWHEGSDTPTLQNPLAAADGSILPTPVSFSEVKQMALGHFVEAIVPTDVAIPMVGYGPSSSYGVGTRSGTTLLHY
jgi:hypothetical protein